MKIWERYFITEFLKSLIFILGALFFLFAVIDFSSRTTTYLQNGMRFQALEILTYYYYEFSLELKILLPFASLLALIKVVSQANLHGELTALMTSGIKLKRLLLPFVLMGLLFTSLLLLNEEFVVPFANKYNNRLLVKKKKEGKKRLQQLPIQTIIFEDSDERLLFSNYDAVKQRFFDVYWIRSFNELYRIKYLYPFTNPPHAQEIALLERRADGILNLSSFNQDGALPNLHLQPHMLDQTLLQPGEFSITELISKSPPYFKAKTDKERQIVTTLLLKVLQPWLVFFSMIGPLPAALVISREYRLFKIYATSIFAFFFVYLFIQASYTLAKKERPRA